MIHEGVIVRVYFVNAGPNLISSFNIVETLLRTVHSGGVPENRLRNMQTFEVGLGNATTVEFMMCPADSPRRPPWSISTP